MYKMLWGKYRDRHAIETYCGFYSAYKWKLVFVVFMYLIKSSPMYIIPIITADVINLIAGVVRIAILIAYIWPQTACFRIGHHSAEHSDSHYLCAGVQQCEPSGGAQSAHRALYASSAPFHALP